MKYKKGTFVTVPNRDILKGEKSSTQNVFFWICDYANEKGECFPSRETLARNAGLKSLRSVDKCLKRLEKIGLITKTIRFKKNSKEKRTNLYQVMIIDYSKDKDGGAGNARGGAKNVQDSGANFAQRTKLNSGQKLLNQNTLKSSDSESQSKTIIELSLSENSEEEKRNEVNLQEKILMWKKVTPKYKDFYKNKTERVVLQKLYDIFPEQEVDFVIRTLPLTNPLPSKGQNSFFWKIFSPSALYRNWEQWVTEYTGKKQQFKQQENRVGYY
jgi:hypothetical protein